MSTVKICFHSEQKYERMVAMVEITMARNFLCGREAKAKMRTCPPGVPSALNSFCNTNTNTWFDFNVSVRLWT